MRSIFVSPNKFVKKLDSKIILTVIFFNIYLVKVFSWEVQTTVILGQREYIALSVKPKTPHLILYFKIIFTS
jgi:hypothetical protein